MAIKLTTLLISQIFYKKEVVREDNTVQVTALKLFECLLIKLNTSSSALLILHKQWYCAYLFQCINECVSINHGPVSSGMFQVRQHCNRQ